MGVHSLCYVVLSMLHSDNIQRTFLSAWDSPSSRLLYSDQHNINTSCLAYFYLTGHPTFAKQSTPVLQ